MPLDATCHSNGFCGHSKPVYQNTGWAQFGYRFSMDFMPYMILMLAAGNRKFGKGFYVAFAISLLVNFFGAITYDRIGMFYYD